MTKRKVTAYKLKHLLEVDRAACGYMPKFRLVETVLGWAILVAMAGEEWIVVDKIGACKYWTVEQAVTNILYVTGGERADLALYPRSGISRD